MDTAALSRIVRHMVDRGTRRGVVRVLATMPLGGTLAILLKKDASEAKKKRKKKSRKRKHKHQGKPKCASPGGTPPQGQACCAGSVLVDGACQRCDVCASGCEFASLQVAIDAASPDATIAVCPGTYRFQNLLISHAVRLVGAGDGEGAGNTIVQGTGEGSVVTISGGVATLERLRITGGDSGNTAGGGLQNQGTTHLINCTISGNTTAYDGGGISHLAGTLTLTDCTVSGNSASGVKSAGGGIASSDILIVTRSTISGNTADDGGGIFNYGGNLSLVASEVSGNSARHGGGIVNTATATATLDTDSRVTGNTADIDGGGIYNVGTVTLASSENVTGNTPDNCAGPTAVAQCSG